jgi:hypothetical protein
MDTSIVDEVVQQLREMPENLQQRVLEFARAVANCPIQGVAGSQLLNFAGTIQPDDIELMREAIAQDCGQVDANEW